MKKGLLLISLLLIPIFMNAQQVVVTNDINSNTTWSASNEYILNGLVFVDSLATLTIQAGTVIKGRKQANITTSEGASALIIRRGGTLMAEGTQDAPIIFTSEDDDINDPNDLTAIDRGLWGGLILLGEAVTNQPTTQNQIEGIPPEQNALYGGNNDNDNSGVLKYISIRHGGFSISGVPGDEINGLTMGAVGDQTVIEHIEVFANFDDGYEWFGGTVHTKWLVAAFCADDAFDYDQGFRGKGQFWFTIQAPDEAGRGGEHDGGDDNETGTPYAIPQIANATYIGAGVGATPGGDGNDRCIYFRDNAGGKYYNSIFAQYAGYGILVEDLASGEDSRSRMENGDLVLSNNFWWDFGTGNNLNGVAPDSGQSQAFVRTHLTNNNNQIVNPQLSNVNWNTNSSMDPRPSTSGPAASGAVTPSDPFFSNVNYYGAFNPNSYLWTEGWTALSLYNHTVVTGIIEQDLTGQTGIPTRFKLRQNYPNPFNPATNIEFDLQKPTYVKLTVYGANGQKVATLVNGYRTAGAYKITWDASGISSGVYFYRLETNSGVETKKMMLLK